MSEELLEILTRILELRDIEHIVTPEGEEPITLLDLDPSDIALAICEELRRAGYGIVKQNVTRVGDVGRMPRCLRLWADTVDEKLGAGWEILALEMRNAAVLIDKLTVVIP